MSVWTSPITWSNGAVTATTMNTEVRDHLNWLKGALDLVTGSSAADTGDSTQLSVTRATTAGVGLQTRVTGEAGQRFRILANGDMAWGGGGGTPTALMDFSNGGVRFHTRVFSASAGIRTLSKAGTVSDSDFDLVNYTGPTSGLMGVDETNRRLYVKVNTVWRYVALV